MRNQNQTLSRGALLTTADSRNCSMNKCRYHQHTSGFHLSLCISLPAFRNISEFEIKDTSEMLKVLADGATHLSLEADHTQTP